jgi:hypothetical protein
LTDLKELEQEATPKSAMTSAVADDDSLKTESEEAEKSEAMSCSHHHDDEDQDNHDLILAGLAQPKRHIDKKRCTMYPDDTHAICWEVAISLVLLTSCFTTPLSLAFPNIEAEHQ